MHLRAVLFDLDDTLADTTGAWQQTWANVAETVRSHVPEADPAILFERYVEASERVYPSVAAGSISIADYRRQCLVEAMQPWGRPTEELFVAYLEERERIVDFLALRPGALELVRGLRRSGILVGVLTNGPGELQRRKLRRLALTDELDGVAISGEIGAVKPDPAAFGIALASLGAEAREAAMVGDSLENDVHGAIRAGFAAAVWMREEDGEAPDGMLAADRLDDVPALLGLTKV